MKYKTIRTKWAAKLLRAKYFVLLTDKESVIAMQGVDPLFSTDVFQVQAQAAEITYFIESLQRLQKDHDQALKKLLKGGKHATNPKSNQTKQKSDRIRRPRAS
jgi:hypothetical protein